MASCSVSSATFCWAEACRGWAAAVLGGTGFLAARAWMAACRRELRGRAPTSLPAAVFHVAITSTPVEARAQVGKDQRAFQQRPALWPGPHGGGVSSRPIPKKLKQEFHAKYGNLKGSEYKKAKRSFYS